MPDVVRSELGLESVFHGGVGCRHDGVIVDELVYRLYLSVDLLRRCADLSLRAEVEFEKAVSDARRGGLDSLVCGLELGEIAAGEDEDARPVTRELEGDFGAKTALRDASDEDWDIYWRNVLLRVRCERE